MVKPKAIKPKSSSSVGSLDRNKKLQEFKKTQGLPTWKELQDDERKGMTTVIDEKLRRMAKYHALNQAIVQTVHSAGWDVTQILHSIVDLQNNLLEYEDGLRAQGINPLSDADYMKAREQLVKEVQFISKQKLDIANFQLKAENKKKNMDDDNIFEVE